MTSTLEDPARLAALAGAGLLDAPAQEPFDRLTRLAARIVRAPIALMTLVDCERQFCVSAVGDPSAANRVGELSHSLCRFVVESAEALVVDDLRRHPRLQSHPALQELGVVGYAGVPVVTADGHVLGAFCVAAREPRAWSDDDVAALQDLSAAAATEIDLRRAIGDMDDQHRRLRDSEARKAAILESALDCVVTMDAEGRVVDFNPAAERTFGYSREEVVGRELSELIVPPSLRAAHRARLARQLATGRPGYLNQRLEMPAVRADGSELPVELTITRTDVGGAPLFTGYLRDLTEVRRAQEDLRDAERRFRALVEQMPTVTYVRDHGGVGRLRYISPQIEAATGYPPDRWTGDADLWVRSIHAEDRAGVVAELRRCVERDEPYAGEYRVVCADGRERTVFTKEVVVRDDQGVPSHRQGSCVDVTDLRRAEAALRASDELNRSVVAILDEGVVVLDADARTITCNDSATRILGLERSALIGARPPFLPLFREDGTRIRPEDSPARAALQSGLPRRDLVLRVLRPDGAEAWLSVNYLPLTDEQDGAVTGLVWSFSDITVRRRSEQEVARLAFHDGLTGLPNRAQLEDHLARSVARAHRSGRAGAVLFIDIDNFKLVNDSLGHAAGDELLRQVAARLAACVRASDLLARHGGDEFMLLLDDLSLDPRSAAEAVAAKLLRALDAPFVVEAADLHVAASIGIALYPRDADTPGELLRHADVAMYAAKRAGRNGYTCYTADSDDSRRRLTLTARLRRALVRDEFRLHYQPVFDLSRSAPVGVEALIRWEDPDEGLIPPDRFIPLAEETGLIDDIGAWALDAGCTQAVAWERAGLVQQLFVNVAPRQLRCPGFADTVRQALDRHGLDPSRLTVEITESAAMSEPQQTDAVLGALHAIGVRVAIDDFGVQHSSLSRLRELPVDMLKIDRSFLRGVPEDPNAAAIITAILTLAGALGMQAVAEGVETAEQQRFLVSEGCPLAQGFHLARPMPAEQATAFLLADAGRGAASQQR